MGATFGYVLANFGMPSDMFAGPVSLANGRLHSNRMLISDVIEVSVPITVDKDSTFAISLPPFFEKRWLEFVTKNHMAMIASLS